MPVHCKGMKIAFATLLLAVVVPQAAVLADSNTGMIRGVVRQYETGKPIANAVVAWVNPSGIGWARTDRDGRFYFLNVTPGLTTLSLRLIGFSPICVKGSVNAGETADVAIG